MLQITRTIRAERPSEEQIGTDSTQANVGNEVAVTQDKTKDNFFVLNADMTLQQNVNRILSIMQFNPFAMNVGDGWRIIEYPHSDKWTKDYIQHSKVVEEEGGEVTIYADVWVQYIKEDVNGTNNYTGVDALTEATAFIETLDASDGWVLGQEWGKTIVIYSRPSLWIVDELGALYVPLDGSAVNPAFGRTDNDRY